MTAPDEKIAAVRRHALADLEASRPTPGPDDPKDAERLAEAARRGRNWLYSVLEMIGDSDRTDHDLAKVIVENESDLTALLDYEHAAARRAEALEAEVGRLEGLLKRGKMAPEIAPRPAFLDAPPADHTERAREIVMRWYDGIYHRELAIDVAAALAAAERAGAEKILRAARACASFRCTVDDGYPPRCPDCGATVAGNDPVRGRCQSDVIKNIKADVIEAYLRRALPLPGEE